MKAVLALICAVLFATSLGGTMPSRTRNQSGRTNPIFAPVGGLPGGTASYDPAAYSNNLNNAINNPPPEDTTPTGGSSGGGGGGYDPSSDPTYQAYIANLDLTQQQQQADTARRIADLQSAQSLSLQNSAMAGEQSRQGISNSYEGRGLFNSGAKLNDLSIQQANQGARENQIKQGTGAQISDLEGTLANAVAQLALKRQSANQGVFS